VRARNGARQWRPYHRFHDRFATLRPNSPMNRRAEELLREPSSSRLQYLDRLNVGIVIDVVSATSPPSPLYPQLPTYCGFTANRRSGPITVIAGHPGNGARSRYCGQPRPVACAARRLVRSSTAHSPSVLAWSTGSAFQRVPETAAQTVTAAASAARALGG